MRPDAPRLDAVEAPRYSREHAAGADLIDGDRAVRLEKQHRLPPAHHARHLLDQPRPDRLRVGDRTREHVGDERHSGRLDLDVLQAPAHHVGRRLHQGAMEGRADRQQHRAPRAEFRRERDGPLDRLLGARDHHLPRRIVVGGLADLAVRRGLGELLRLRKIGAEQRRHGAFADRHGLLHRAPLILRSRAVSARLRAPAAASAEYSPSECPAT